MDCSLGEVSKRIEFGLACSCLTNKIKPQTFVSAKVDEFSSASSFIPAKLVNGMKILAKCPSGGIDNLEFATTSAQLLAFNRWKGFYELPEFTMRTGLDGDVDEEKTDFEGVTDDVNLVPDGHKRVSLRKQKPNHKHSEDNIVGDDVPKASKDIDGSSEELSNVAIGIKRNSSRKRKPNPKYCEDECTTQSGLIEEDVVGSHVLKKDISSIAKEITQVSAQKRKAKFKHSENGGKAYMDEDVVGAHKPKDPEGFAKDVNQVPEEETLVSERKRKRNTIDSEDEDKPYSGLKEDVLDAHVSKEMKDLEGATEDERIVPKRNQGVSLRKRNPKTKYNEEREDSEGVDKDAIWVPEENVRVSRRKRKPNMKYSEDGDYSFVDMGEQGDDPVLKDSGLIGDNSSSKGSSKRCCEVSHGKKLSPEEYPPPDGMLSQLHIAASDPMKGYSLLSSLLGFFADYRNSFSQWRPKRSISSKRSGVEGAEGSYQVDTIERETNGAGYRDEKTKEDYTPTAVILFFVDIDSVPSKSDLHHVFDSYGPLNKAHTEVVKRLRRCRVVFKRRSDAENAYRSTGRFSIFGPSLVSYRLSYFYPE